jgi:hypothetical protein
VVGRWPSELARRGRKYDYFNWLLEAAFAMFAAHYNFVWRTRKPGKTSKKRPTAAMLAGLTDHLWSFDEFFAAVMQPI